METNKLLGALQVIQTGSLLLIGVIIFLDSFFKRKEEILNHQLKLMMFFLISQASVRLNHTKI